MTTADERPPFGRAVWVIKVLCGRHTKDRLLADPSHPADRPPVLTFGWGSWERHCDDTETLPPTWTDAPPDWRLVDPGAFDTWTGGRRAPLWKPGTGDRAPGKPPTLAVGGHLVFSRRSRPADVRFRPWPSEPDGGAVYRLFCPHCELGAPGTVSDTQIDRAQEVRHAKLAPVLDALRERGAQRVTLSDLIATLGTSRR